MLIRVVFCNQNTNSLRKKRKVSIFLRNSPLYLFLPECVELRLEISFEFQ